ncbi:MAG: haloacid dehalogenase-like hydrolase [Candidatus Acidiferrales bacterium]
MLPSPSLEWRFIGYLLARDEIRSASVGRWLAHAAKTILRDPRAAVGGNKLYLSGLRESLVRDWEDSLVADLKSSAASATGPLPLFAEGIERIAWHLAQHHRVVFVSGTLAPLTRVVANRFCGMAEVQATELEVCDGFWTGWLAGEHLIGAAKSHIIGALANKYDLDLARSYAYGDTAADLPMLEGVGHPVAINPTIPLWCVARKSRWQSYEWKELKYAPESVHGRLLAARETR